MSNFKSVTIRDPLGYLPDLVLYPDSDGYSRAVINRRKANGRTPTGTTKIAGTPSQTYFNWQLTFALVKPEDAELFETYLEINNQRLLPGSAEPEYLLLVDRFKETPAVPNPRWDFVSGSEVTRPYQLNGQPLITGFGIFKVVPSIDASYSQFLGSCRHKISFSLEEVN